MWTGVDLVQAHPKQDLHNEKALLKRAKCDLFIDGFCLARTVSLQMILKNNFDMTSVVLPRKDIKWSNSPPLKKDAQTETGDEGRLIQDRHIRLIASDRLKHSPVFPGQFYSIDRRLLWQAFAKKGPDPILLFCSFVY